MTKKIFRSIIAVAAVVLAACFVLILGILYSHFTSVQKDNLQSELALASTAVEKNGLDYLESVDEKSCRFTWIAADGKVNVEDFPLLMHVDDILTNKAGVNIPWEKFTFVSE